MKKKEVTVFWNCNYYVRVSNNSKCHYRNGTDLYRKLKYISSFDWSKRIWKKIGFWYGCITICFYLYDLIKYNRLFWALNPGLYISLGWAVGMSVSICNGSRIIGTESIRDSYKLVSIYTCVACRKNLFYSHWTIN